MLLSDLLERNAKLCGEDTALVELNPIHDDAKNLSWQEYELVETGHASHYRRELTWRAFDERANRFARLLADKGIRRGDKVAILLMNCIDWLPIYFGVLKTGAIAVPLNFRYTAEEIAYCADLSDARALIFGPEFLDRVGSVRRELAKVATYVFVGMDAPDYANSFEGLIDRYAPEPPAIELAEEDDAAIYFSSGTTGFPKAILHTQASLMSAAVTEQTHHGQTKDDVFLLIPPLYHTGAKMHWFGSLMSGSRAVILKGTSPQWVLETAAEERATIVWLLVPWAQDILDAIENGDVDLSRLDLSRWRLMHIGAQPVPPSLIKRWKKHFPHHLYDTNYGLSESIGPGSVHLGVGNMHKVGAIGKAGHRWRTRIVDGYGAETPQGEVGELIVKGPGVMKEYYNDPEATAAALRDGWLYTGDMAMEDEDGFIYLVDRKKDVIITGGENIYPVQIEDFMRKNDKIKDVAVIGVADHRLGEIAVAIVELKAGVRATEEELQSFAGALPRYKRPKKIIFDEVPRNPTGKIEKPKLRRKYGADAIVAKETEIGVETKEERICAETEIGVGVRET
ncbi:MAG: AMP-binding protein [Clostridiales Family XIII bacterium]|jgi:acyl-CoA synthetase (AMP-forming)/AMP-acid ligase II|nr:AMP-binding protein [Clostridiales Family XIII bacterium]